MKFQAEYTEDDVYISCTKSYNCYAKKLIPNCTECFVVKTFNNGIGYYRIPKEILRSQPLKMLLLLAEERKENVFHAGTN